MRQRTFRILDHLPIIGSTIKRHAGVVWWCSPFREWYFNDPEAEPVRKWAEKHPDEALTNKILHEILKNSK